MHSHDTCQLLSCMYAVYALLSWHTHMQSKLRIYNRCCQSDTCCRGVWYGAKWCLRVRDGTKQLPCLVHPWLKNCLTGARCVSSCMHSYIYKQYVSSICVCIFALLCMWLRIRMVSDLDATWQLSPLDWHGMVSVLIASLAASVAAMLPQAQASKPIQTH